MWRKDVEKNCNKYEELLTLNWVYYIKGSEFIVSFTFNKLPHITLLLNNYKFYSISYLYKFVSYKFVESFVDPLGEVSIISFVVMLLILSYKVLIFKSTAYRKYIYYISAHTFGISYLLIVTILNEKSSSNVQIGCQLAVP